MNLVLWVALFLSHEVWLESSVWECGGGMG